MNERQQKKKKSTMAELAVGSGLGLIFLPVILLALVWAIIALGFSLAYMVFMQENLAAFRPVLVVYGGLLVAMLFLAYKFSVRFALLMRRLIGLMRERRRLKMQLRVAGRTREPHISEQTLLLGDKDAQTVDTKV